MAVNNLRDLISTIRSLLRRKPLQSKLGVQYTLPDFDHFPYLIAVPPAGSKVEAWKKLQESERRLTMVKWCEILNDPRIPQNRTLINDAVSAFLLTFEATIQFLLNQYELSNGNKTFYTWLNAQPQHDITVRGLRTLRRFEAHVESKQSHRLVRLRIGDSQKDSTSVTEVSTSWHLPKLQSSDIVKLRNAPLGQSELTDWNNRVVNTDIESLFTQGLQQLKEILETAEYNV